MQTIRSMLVPVDFSAGSALALRHALALRRGERALARGAKISVVHAGDLSLAEKLAEEGPRVAEATAERVRKRLRLFLGNALGDEAAAPDLAIDFLPGDAREVIPLAAADHDLVVIGAAGERAEHPLLPGGVAETVVRRSPVPVLTVKPGGLKAPGRPAFAPAEVVFATDFTAFSAAALRYAMAIGFAYDARLTALHVAGRPGEIEAFRRMPFPLREEVERFYEKDLGWERDELGRFLRDRLGADRPVEIREVLRTGRPAREIAAECADRGADLLILATHGHGGLKRRILGSVAEGALRLAPCSVLTVRPPSPSEATGL